MSRATNDRILVIDDSPSIHHDYERILRADAIPQGLEEMRAALFEGETLPNTSSRTWAIDYALQGLEGVDLATKARAEGRPYAIAFVDMRMPPGINGLETIERLWQVDPALEVVICTAFADHPWEEITARLGATGRLLVLKKPFDSVEILQLATTLAEKWILARENEAHVAQLEARVAEKTRELAQQVEVATLAAEESRQQSIALSDLNAALCRASAEAGAANRAKSEFLTNMSHEIRTPMTAILGYAELLLEEELPRAALLEHVGTIRRNGEYLVSLINDILDLSRIEAGALLIEKMATSPEKLVNEVAALMSVRAAEKNLTFEVVRRTPLPARITTDPLRLRQIIVNLVGNAIKFTEHGSVRVVMGIEGTGADARLVVEVVDTGIGISRSGQSRLFQPFSQADASTSRRFGGTGLGLSIARHLAVLLGGAIELSSSEGRGSTFRFHVSAAPVEDECAPAAPAPAPAGRSLHGLRILLAEDGRDNQRLISLFLTRAGATVEIAEDGLRALEAGRESLRAGRQYDVMLMDMQMPNMDGYAATRALRAVGYTAPIVAVTAHAMSGDRERCLEAGTDEYETKPVDRVRLIELCSRLAAREPKAPLPASPLDASTPLDERRTA
jgi:signal transduction histidine kinase